MKVLHVMPYSPEPPIFGGALRNYHLLKNLAEYHQVTLVCFGTSDAALKLKKKFNANLREIHVIPDPPIRKYRRLGQLYAHWTKDSFLQLACRSQEMQTTLDRLLSGNVYDLIQTEFCMMGSYQFRTDALKILDAHNVEHEIYRRMAVHTDSWLRKWHYDHEYQRLYNEELVTYRKQDAIFVTSERDKEFLDVDIPNIPKFIIPNGVDVSYFKPSEQAPEATSLVFTGLMGYVPNYDGIFYFLEEIFPIIQKEIPQVKIYIVGDRPPKALLKRAGEHVVVTGFVDDVRPYVWRSSVYVVPLRMGGGTRLKVLEAMAMKKPIVTTSIGCEGIDVDHGESVLIADNPQEFAQSVIELVCNESLQKHLTRNGYDLVHRQYAWSVIGKQMELIYQRMIQSAPMLENEATIYG
jgi:glycosyltransferase involved in cell wall biosynthesis